MKQRTDGLGWIVRLGCAVIVSVGASALPAHAAKVNVIHGIDGRDLGASRDLPVDIAVNGVCSLRGVTFTQQALVELGTGTYQITVHPSDGACSNGAVIAQSVTIPSESETSRFTAVASLTASKAPQLAVFETQLFAPRVSVTHLAAAGPINVEVSATDYKYLGRPIKSRIKNGQQGASYGFLARRIRYRIDIKTGSQRARRRLEGSVTRAQRNFLVVGSLQNGLTVISEDVR